jgi:hypothetical protein
VPHADCASNTAFHPGQNHAWTFRASDRTVKQHVQQEQNVDELQDQVGEIVAIVVGTDTVVEPRAMVVESIHASTAVSAMFGAHGFEQLIAHTNSVRLMLGKSKKQAYSDLTSGTNANAGRFNLPKRVQTLVSHRTRISKLNSDPTYLEVGNSRR